MPIISGSQGGAGAMTRLYLSTLSGAAANFDVTAISQAYTHLLVILAARGDTAATSTAIQGKLNNDGGANYDRENISGAGSTATSNTGVAAATTFFAGTATANTASANTFGVSQMVLPYYATGSSMFRMILQTDASFFTTGTITTYGLDAVASMWRSTAAINRITLTPAAGNFNTGSSLSIYGIL